MEAFTLTILALALIVVTTAAVYLWRRSRRLARDLATARSESDEWGALIALEHSTNYAMACQLYGKSAVDRAMRDACEKGVN